MHKLYEQQGSFRRNGHQNWPIFLLVSITEQSTTDPGDSMTESEHSTVNTDVIKTKSGDIQQVLDSADDGMAFKIREQKIVSYTAQM